MSKKQRLKKLKAEKARTWLSRLAGPSASESQDSQKGEEAQRVVREPRPAFSKAGRPESSRVKAETIVRGIHRQRLHEIWQGLEEGELPDNPEEANLARMMKEHPQYESYWDRPDALAGKDVTDEHRVNPFLHISLETALENQLQSEEIPEVKQALDHLVSKGTDKHQARHQVLGVLTDEIWHMRKGGRPFDAERYRAGLRRLMK